MAQLKVSSSISYNTIEYASFKGVDFTADPSLVDRKRSPDMLNMISDNGGNPIKRRGWGVWYDGITDKIDNMWTYTGTNYTYLVVNAGGSIYTSPIEYKLTETFTADGSTTYTVSTRIDATDNIIVSSSEGEYSVSSISNKTITLATAPTSGLTVTIVYYGMAFTKHTLGLTAGKKVAINTTQGLMIFADTSFIMCDKSGNLATMAKGATLTDGSTFEPYVPTIIVGATAGTATAGGTVNESVNLMTRERKETFFPDGTATTFTVSSTVDTSKAYSAWHINETTGATEALTISSVSDKTFTLSSAVAKSTSNVVTFQYFATGGTDNTSKICSAVYQQEFAEGSSKRWFVVNENTNIVRYSGLGDYTYWPDLNYVVVGNNENKVQGFLPVGEYLGVIKESAERESTLYFIAQTTLTDTYQSVGSDGNIESTTSERYVYKITPAAAGVGAVSHQTFAVLNDEPLFLSKQGIFGIVSNTTTSEKAIRSRSGFLDGKLLNEDILNKAIACIYKGYYVLVVNEHAYVLDGRQKTTDYSGNTSYNYEGYYWDNIPATCLFSFNDKLMFGCADGKICKFKYTGNNSDYTDNGAEVCIVWSTKYDNDGYPQYLKTMQKKGSSVTVKPYPESSVDVYYEADGNEKKYIGTGQVNIWDKGFSKIDFDNFVFDTRKGPRDKYINKKIKKYHRLKIIVENNNAEPFGIYSITKTFANVKYAKK